MNIGSLFVHFSNGRSISVSLLEDFTDFSVLIFHQCHPLGIIWWLPDLLKLCVELSRLLWQWRQVNYGCKRTRRHVLKNLNIEIILTFFFIQNDLTSVHENGPISTSVPTKVPTGLATQPRDDNALPATTGFHKLDRFISRPIYRLELRVLWHSCGWEGQIMVRATNVDTYIKVDSTKVLQRFATKH